VTAEIDFKQNLPEGKSADDLAKETATAWCEQNTGWEYTGNWKNEAKGEAEVSTFEVQKNALTDSTASHKTEANKKADPRIEEELDKSKEEDARQSFVEQVSLGLSKKVPPERFEKEEDAEDAKAGEETKAYTKAIASPVEPAAAAAP